MTHPTRALLLQRLQGWLRWVRPTRARQYKRLMGHFAAARQLAQDVHDCACADAATVGWARAKRSLDRLKRETEGAGL